MACGQGKNVFPLKLHIGLRFVLRVFKTESYGDFSLAYGTR